MLFIGDVETDPNMDFTEKDKSYRKTTNGKELSRFSNVTSSIESLDGRVNGSDDSHITTPHTNHSLHNPGIYILYPGDQPSESG